MASNRVIEQYKRERDKYQRKIRAMERQNPDYDWRGVLGWGANLRDVRKLTTREVNKDMQGFTAKYGHVMEDRKGVRAPRAYWEQYDRALRRENARRERARKTATTKYEVPNNLRPPEKAGERFAKFVAHVLDLADPLYRQAVTKQMQDNYLYILRSTKYMYVEAYNKANLNKDDLKKIIDLLENLIKYVSKLPPQEFYRKYLADSENRIDFEVIYIQDEWELEDVIQEFTEILDTWRRL